MILVEIVDHEAEMVGADALIEPVLAAGNDLRFELDEGEVDYPSER